MIKDAFDSLIFDLDGTLWDSTVPVANAWNQTAADLGVDEAKVAPDDIAGIMGMTDEKVFAKLLPDATPTERKNFAKQFYLHEIKAIRKQGGKLYPGVVEGLPKLSQRYPLYIVSNCQPEYLDTFFHLTGLRSLFKGWKTHGATGLPKGDNIASLVKTFGLEVPAYIGDTAGDQEAAGRAGVEYFHVNYGFGNPTKHCERFEDFRSILQFFIEQI